MLIGPRVHLFDDCLDGARCDALADRLVDLTDEYGLLKDGPGSSGEVCRYSILDGFVVKDRFPELEVFYELAAVLAGTAFDAPVKTSSYDRSSINAKIYFPPGDVIGMHFDSNCVTGILYLNDSDAALVIRCSDDVERTVQPRRGRLVLFDGKTQMHGSQPSSGVRVTVVMNFYFAGASARPDWVDRLEYENDATVGAPDLE